MQVREKRADEGGVSTGLVTCYPFVPSMPWCRAVRYASSSRRTRNLLLKRFEKFDNRALVRVAQLFKVRCDAARFAAVAKDGIAKRL
jgi:hypothetical protein